jgi:hypothetical protein
MITAPLAPGQGRFLPSDSGAAWRTVTDGHFIWTCQYGQNLVHILCAFYHVL